LASVSRIPLGAGASSGTGWTGGTIFTIHTLKSNGADGTGLTRSDAAQNIAYICTQFIFGNGIVLDIIIANGLRGNFVCRNGSIQY
jgi:hypothetical protein